MTASAFSPTRPPAIPAGVGGGLRGPWSPVVRWIAALSLTGLTAAAPLSAADGTGWQLDELVLGVLGVVVAVLLALEVRDRAPGGRAPWVVLVGGAAAFAVSQLAMGLAPGPALDGFGIDDLLLLAGGSSPLLAGALLAAQLTRTRWSALVVDGAIVAVSLVVVAVAAVDALVPGATPGDRGDRTLLLSYAGYAAVVVGGAAASLTVATTASRRSASTLLVSCLLLGLASAAGAVELGSGSAWATWACGGLSGAAVVGGLVAARQAPRGRAAPGSTDEAPVASRAGTAVLCAALLAVPVVVGGTMLTGHPLSSGATEGLAAVAGLMAVRLVLRVRESGELTRDLVRSELDLRDVVEHSVEGLVVLDDDLRLHYSSPTARRLLDLPVDSSRTGGSFPDLVAAGERTRVRQSLQLAGAHPVLAVAVVPALGAVRELQVLVHQRPHGGLLLQLRDVTVQQRRERELEQLAYTDRLTGLLNAAGLAREVGAWSRSGGDRSVVFLDLDRFKTVSDVLGEAAGDQVLVEVARRLERVAGPGAVVARSGGDSFTLLLPVDRATGLVVADRIARSLARPYPEVPQHLPRGASVGTALLLPGGFARADRAARAAVRAVKAAGGGAARAGVLGVD